MKKSEILHVIKEELDIVLEVKLRKGDFVSQDDEIGVVNKVKGRVAYVKFPSTGAKSFDPVLVSDVKYKGKFKGKDLYLAEAATCSSQSNRNEQEKIEEAGNYKDVSNKFKNALDVMPEKYFNRKGVIALIKKLKEKKPDAAMAYAMDAFGWMSGMKEGNLNEAEYVIIDTRGNARDIGSKIQGQRFLKGKKGFHIVLKKNALKARRAIEKNGGKTTGAKISDTLYDMMNESMIGIKTKANFKPLQLKIIGDFIGTKIRQEILQGSYEDN